MKSTTYIGISTCITDNQIYIFPKGILKMNWYKYATLFMVQYSMFIYTYVRNKSIEDLTIEGKYILIEDV